MKRQFDALKAETRALARSIAEDARTACARGNYYCHIRLGQYYLQEAVYRSGELEEMFGTGDAWIKLLNTDEQRKTFLANAKKCFSRFLSERRRYVNPAIENGLGKYVMACANLLSIDGLRPEGEDRDHLKLIRRALLDRVANDRAQFSSLEASGGSRPGSYTRRATDAESWIRCSLFAPGEEGYQAPQPIASEPPKNVLALKSTPENPLKSWLARLTER